MAIAGFAGDAGDEEGAVADAAIRQKGVGGGDLVGGGFPGAKVGGGVAIERDVEGHAGHFFDVAHAGVVADAYGHGVAGFDEAVGGGIHAAVDAIGIFRVPVGGGAADFASADVGIRDRAIGPETFIKGGHVNEGLEDGTDLAAGLQGAVEFGFIGGTATDDGEDFAGLAFDDACRALDVGGLRLAVDGDGLPLGAGLVGVAGSALDAGECGFDGFFCALLDAFVDGGGDVEATHFDIFLFEDVFEVAADGINGVGFADFSAALGADVEGEFFGGIDVLGGDELGIEHAV